MNTTPFELMAQEVDEVILFINYFIEKSEQKEIEVAPKKEETKRPMIDFWDF